MRPNFVQALLARHTVADKIGRDERVDDGVLQARFEHTNVLVHRLEKEVDEQPHADGRVAVAGQHPEKDDDRGKEQQRHHHRNGKQQLVVVGHVDGDENFLILAWHVVLVAKQQNEQVDRREKVGQQSQDVGIHQARGARATDHRELDLISVGQQKGKRDHQKKGERLFKVARKPKQGVGLDRG